MCLNDLLALGNQGITEADTRESQFINHPMAGQLRRHGGGFPVYLEGLVLNNQMVSH